MNRIFKVIFSKAKGLFVVASENAKKQGKSTNLKAVVGAVMVAGALGLSGNAMAVGPEIGTVKVDGTVVDYSNPDFTNLQVGSSSAKTVDITNSAGSGIYLMSGQYFTLNPFAIHTLDSASATVKGTEIAITGSEAAVWTTGVSTATVGETGKTDTVKLKGSDYAVEAAGNKSSITVNSKNTSIFAVKTGVYSGSGAQITVNSTDKTGIKAEGTSKQIIGVDAYSSGSVNLAGGAITIDAKQTGYSSSDGETHGIRALEGTVAISGTSLTVNVSSANASGLSSGILVQNNTEKAKGSEGYPTNPASVSVTADTINITNTSTNGSGLSAWSNGKMDINGNLTVTATNAIDVRGNSTMNINTDGVHTTVLNGDVVFETPDDATSGKLINADVNLNLTGAGSSWTGRSYQQMGTKVSTALSGNDSTYGDVTDFDVTVADGAKWNVTGNSFVNTLNMSDGGVVNGAWAGDAATGSNNGTVNTINIGTLTANGDADNVLNKGTYNVTSANGSGTLQIGDGSDTTKDTTLVISAGNNAGVLDTLVVKGDGKVDVGGSLTYNHLVVDGGEMDVSGQANGNMGYDGENWYGYTKEESSITVKSGTVNIEGANAGMQAGAVDIQGGTVTVTGSAYTDSGVVPKAATALGGYDGFTMSGGDVTLNNARLWVGAATDTYEDMDLSGGKITMNNGGLTGMSYKGDDGIEGNTIKLDGVEIEVKSGDKNVINSAAVEMDGGKVTVDSGSKLQVSTYMKDDSEWATPYGTDTNADITIKSGTVDVKENAELDLVASKVTNGGEITNAGTTDVTGDLVNTGSITNTAGILIANNGIDTSAGTLSVDGGTVRVDGESSNLGDGKTAVAAGAILDLAGGDIDGGAVTNAGTLQVSAADADVDLTQVNNNDKGEIAISAGTLDTKVNGSDTSNIGITGGTLTLIDDSSLGNVTNEGGKLDIGDTDTTAVTMHSNDTATGTNSGDAITKINGGTLSITDKDTTAYLGNVEVGENGAGNTFAMDSQPKIDMATLTSNGDTNITTSNGKDKGQVTVGTIYGDGNVNLDLNRKAANELKGNSPLATAQDAANVIDIAKSDNDEDEKAKGFNVHVAEGDVAGEITAKTDSNGNIISVSEAKNSTLSTMMDIASNNFLVFREQMNDVSKRMGDLRTEPKADGAWARLSAGHAQYKSVNSSYQTIQIGADHRIGDFYVGAEASYTDADGNVKRGDTDDKNYTFGIYGGWVGESGQYVDVIVKHHHLDTDYDTRNVYGDKVKGSYNLTGYSASVEYGWRLGIENTNFYVEPQAELMYGHMESASFKSNNGIKFKQDSIDSVIGRLGVAAGWVDPDKKGSFYVKASVLNDWDADAYMKASKNGVSRKYHEDMGGTWVEYAVGGTYNLAKDWSIYGEAQTTSGNPTRTTYQVNAGIRYSFQ